MGKLLRGVAAKIDLNDGSFSAASSKRLATTGVIDVPILHHRASAYASGVLLDIESEGSQGPIFWDGSDWARKGFLIRVPRALVIGSSIDLAEQINTSFTTLARAGVSVFYQRGDCGNTKLSQVWPMLFGVPVDSFTQVDQPGSFIDPITVPNLVSSGLYRGSQVMVAIVTDSRVAFRATSGGSGQANTDYCVAGFDSPTYTGYETFKNDATHGWTVAMKDADDHRTKLSMFAAKCDSFKMTFYQADRDEDPGSNSSAVIDDSTLDQIIGGVASRKRYPYLDASTAFHMILDDASNFFS